MKKWICRKCGKNHPCVLIKETPYGAEPLACVCGEFSEADWEFCEDEEITIKLPSEENKSLPEWCKPGAWIFDHNERRYAKVLSIGQDGLVEFHANRYKYSEKRSFEYIADCCSEARLRPYNHHELKALVGKVLETIHTRRLVTACEDGEDGDKSWAIYMVDEWYTAEDLLRYNYTLHGNPCGVFEFNDAGEWRNEIRVCRRCKTPVKISDNIEYSYYCPEHNEDLYEFETEEILKYQQEAE